MQKFFIVEAGAEVTEEVLQRARLSNKFIERRGVFAGKIIHVTKIFRVEMIFVERRRLS
ncbi:MAG: hypothetical protein IKP64_12870 [Selenomonadaceae bacterium]|nr:hypothetical protein [Selenomonadaceae bacterium]MBR4384435.1 hypothetical protein [Selenomonadaceae bacterium]